MTNQPEDEMLRCSATWNTHAVFSHVLFHLPQNHWVGDSSAPRASRSRRQSQFGRPHPARSWQHRCEEWVWANGCRNLTQTPHIGVSIPAWKLRMTVTLRNWRQTFQSWKSLTVLELNNRFARSYTHFEISGRIEHSNCCASTFQITVIQYIRIVTTSESKYKN